MIDWGRLGIAVLCTAILWGGCIVFIHLFSIDVFFALVIAAFVLMDIFLFYKALGDILDKDKKWNR